MGGGGWGWGVLLLLISSDLAEYEVCFASTDFGARLTQSAP